MPVGVLCRSILCEKKMSALTPASTHERRRQPTKQPHNLSKLKSKGFHRHTGVTNPSKPQNHHCNTECYVRPAPRPAPPPLPTPPNAASATPAICVICGACLLQRPVNKGLRLDYFICSSSMFEEGTTGAEASGTADTAVAGAKGGGKKKSGGVGGGAAKKNNNKKTMTAATKKMVVHDCFNLDKATVGLSDHCPIGITLRPA